MQTKITRNVSGSNILPYCVPIQFLRHLKLIQRPKNLQNFVTTALAVRQKIYGHNIHYSSVLLHIKMSKPKISRAYEFLGLLWSFVGSFVLCIFKLNRTISLRKNATRGSRYSRVVTILLLTIPLTGIKYPYKGLSKYIYHTGNLILTICLFILQHKKT